MAVHITAHREGFPPGRTEITNVDDAEDGVGITFAVHVLAGGESVQMVAGSETAWLLMRGSLSVTFADKTVALERQSLFDDLPSCLHVAANTSVAMSATSDVELTVYSVPNQRPFEPRLYRPEDVRNERRGEGALRDASFRFVRTIFDATTTSDEAELVLGEVVNLPGRWSSYPPHHHPQNEIYHYRFSDPRGYGHAELGEDVKKVRPFDTIKIKGGLDHSQCAAPGYAMYYSWVIRHLPEARYDVPEFTEAHRWTMTAGADGWWPRGED